MGAPPYSPIIQPHSSTVRQMSVSLKMPPSGGAKWRPRSRPPRPRLAWAPSRFSTAVQVGSVENCVVGVPG